MKIVDKLQIYYFKVTFLNIHKIVTNYILAGLFNVCKNEDDKNRVRVSLERKEGIKKSTHKVSKIGIDCFVSILRFMNV